MTNAGHDDEEAQPTGAGRNRAVPAAASARDGREMLRFGTASGRWTIVATVLGSGIAALDGTVVGIALPTIGRQFHADVSSLQWVVTSYTLSLAGLLLTPGSLAILEATFAPEDRSRAIGAWSGFGGVASAIGPFLGGWLIEAVSWRLVFFINLPLAVAGAALITLGLTGLTFGLIRAGSAGWTAPAVLGALAGGVVLLGLFLVVEARTPHPMLPLGLFRSRQFSAANAVTFVVYAALAGGLFLLPVELQVVAGYSPIASGAALLPVTFIMLALSCTGWAWPSTSRR